MVIFDTDGLKPVKVIKFEGGRKKKKGKKRVRKPKKAPLKAIPEETAHDR